MERISCSFFWHYSLKAFRKKRIHKMLVAAICAGAVAFTAMCTGFLRNYTDLQNEYMKNISERELIVYNNVSVENVYSLENPPISSSAIKEIHNIGGTQTVVPLISFYSLPVGFTVLGVPDELSIEEYNKEQASQNVSTIEIANSLGLKKAEKFEVNMGDNYLTVSYPIAQTMDEKSLYLDESVTEGGYITESFMERLGLSFTDLKDLSLAFECWVNPLQREDTVKVFDQTDDSTEIETSFETRYFPWTQKTTITTKIRGIIPDVELPQEGDIFLPADQMIQVVRECPLEMEKLNRFIKGVEKINPNKDIPAFFEWAPNAYYVVANSIENVEPIKAKLQDIDPNFEIVHFYQDFTAGIQILTNNRNTMLLISFVVLSIVLLLVSLIYVSLIDKRRYEFAVLRANGMTKKEVRRIIYIEMLVQFSLIFIIGVVFAEIIFLITRVWLGYAFQFDAITMLWLFTISLASIVLPTAISLLFVNKFEPDAVMRN